MAPKLPDWDEQASNLMNYRDLLDEVTNMVSAANKGWDEINGAQKKVLNIGKDMLKDARDLFDAGQLNEEQFKRRIKFTKDIVSMNNDLTQLNEKEKDLQSKISYYKSKSKFSWSNKRLNSK